MLALIINATDTVTGLETIKDCQNAYEKWQFDNGMPRSSEMFADSVVLEDGSEIWFLSYNGKYWDWSRDSNALTKATVSSLNYAKFKNEHPEFFKK